MYCVKKRFRFGNVEGKRKKIIKLPGVEPVKRRKKGKRKEKNTEGIRVECL